MSMDLEALRAFLAVVDSGSFVAAATALRGSRATVRRRVEELEARAGVPLLHRTENGATPTAAGTLLASRGRGLLAEASALFSAVREVAESPSRTLRVVLPVGLPPRLLSLLFGLLRGAQPELQLHVRVAEDPLALLLQDVDVALCFGDEPHEGPWVSREIVRVPERLVASPSYLAAHGVPGNLEELQRHVLLMWEGPERRGPFLPLRAGGEVAVTPSLVSSDLHTLREAASDDLGILFTVDAPLPSALVAGPELIPVLDEEIGRERVLRVVMPAAFPDIRRILAVLERVATLVEPTRSRR